MGKRGSQPKAVFVSDLNRPDDCIKYLLYIGLSGELLHPGTDLNSSVYFAIFYWNVFGELYAPRSWLVWSQSLHQERIAESH